MLKQSNNRPLQTQITHGTSDIPWWPILSAVALLIVGGGFFFALPEQTGSESPAAPAPAAAQPAPDDSLCSRQTWPYIDQRCAQRINAARDTRQVRIVTDKGTSVTTVTPVPIVEPKTEPEQPKPVVAENDRPIGPPAAPTADAAPQVEKVATAAAPSAAPPPASAANAMAQDNPDSGASKRETSGVPPVASSAPVASGVDFFDGPPAKKSKAQRAAATREKREAKRRQKLEERLGGVPAEVAAAVRAATSGERNSRRGRKAVPDEVLAEVERATAAIERRDREVTVDSPGTGGRRIFIVPHDGGGW